MINSNYGSSFCSFSNYDNLPIINGFQLITLIPIICLMKELLLALLLLFKVFFMKTTHVLGQKTEKTKDRNMKINLRQF